MKMPAHRCTHRARRPQIEELFALVPIAAARQVVDGASHWLCVPLPERYATRLAFQARRCYAHSDLFRAKISRPGDKGARPALRFHAPLAGRPLENRSPQALRPFARELCLRCAAPLSYREQIVGSSRRQGPMFL